MNDFFILHIFIAGLVTGIILYQSIVVASTVFKLLKIDQSSILLRSVFPKFFKVISILGLINFSVGFILSSQIYFQLVSIITLTLALICLFIIPKTNKAKDLNNTKLFQLLHSISVILTMIILLFNISMIFMI